MGAWRGDDKLVTIDSAHVLRSWDPAVPRVLVQAPLRKAGERVASVERGVYGVAVFSKRCRDRFAERFFVFDEQDFTETLLVTPGAIHHKGSRTMARFNRALMFEEGQRLADGHERDAVLLG